MATNNSLNTLNVPLSLTSGTGAISIGADATNKSITIGSSSISSQMNFVTGSGTINLGIGGAKTINIGNNTGATFVTIASGSSGLVLTTAAANSGIDLQAATASSFSTTTGSLSFITTSGAINIGTAGAKTITIGNVTTTTAVNINTGTNGSVLTTTNGVYTVNTGTGTVSISGDATANTVGIGTGAGAKTVTVGSTNSTSSLTLNSGTGGIALASTSTGDITLNSSDTLLLDSAGILELNSSAGAISIGNDAVSQAINIGTGAAARTITVGNTTGATSLVLNSGSGGISLTGATNINTTGGAVINIGNATGGTLTLESTSIYLNPTGTGIVYIGNETDPSNEVKLEGQLINIGTSTLDVSVAIGSTSTNSYASINAGDDGEITIGTTSTANVTIGQSSGDQTVTINTGSGGINIPSFTTTGALVSDTTGVITDADASTAGFVLTSNGSGSVPTFQAPALLLFNNVSGTSVSMDVNNGYIMDNGSLVTGTLPATAAQGTVIKITGKGTGLWSIAQNSGQTIHYGAANTTTGVTGSLSAATRYDSVELVCITADTDWVVTNAIGSLVPL